MANRVHRIVAWILPALALAGCGGGASTPRETTPVAQEAPPPQTAAHARGGDEVRARVGRLGGTLELGNGARLEIDEGVLTDEIEIVMRNGSEAHVFETAETQTPLGPLVEVEPAIDGSRRGGFHYSVTAVRIPAGYPEADLALAVEESGAQREHFVSATQTRWQMYPAAHHGDRFEGELDSLAGHRLQFGVSR
jgi:hypothetical protein